ncbi:hypothetical protein [Streptosporangium subroseum]|nr:hypothetical protein OHB15_02710 [Streptosporangium subroseum]
MTTTNSAPTMPPEQRPPFAPEPAEATATISNAGTGAAPRQH